MQQTYIGGKKREDFADLEDLFKGVEEFMGYVPNAHLTMAEKPELLLAFSNLAMTVFQSKGIDMQTKQLIALASSLSSGCKYCQAHTSHGAHQTVIQEEKLQDLLRYEESEFFSLPEKAAIAIALAAGRVPNETSTKHFDNLREHFEERQIVQIVAVISLFGFLNRWNDTMATQLESEPTEFAESVLSDGGWALGKHKG